MNGPDDPEIAMALAYAPAKARPVLEALWALDAQFGHVVRGTTEPLIGEMRLTWWQDAIVALAHGPAPDEPLLQRLKAALPDGALGAIAEMAQGWIELLAPLPLETPALDRYAALRGGILFRQCGLVLGTQEDVGEAGAGWALVDFAFRCSDRATAERAVALAIARLEPALARRWSPAARPLGIIAHLALRDARAGIAVPPRRGSPGRMLRAIRHRLTGR